MESSCKRLTTSLRSALAFFLASAACAALTTTGVLAAGFPDNGQLAECRPERTLSGIRVGIRPLGTRLPQGTPISEIVKLYGPPASKEDAVVPDGAGGTRFYRWEWPGLKMSVATYFYYLGDHQQNFVESGPAYIDVWGDGPKGRIGSTGRGLALGSTLREQIAVYGNRYSIPHTEKDGSTHVETHWSNGAFLMIDYGPNGRSNHIRLTCREK